MVSLVCWAMSERVVGVLRKQWGVVAHEGFSRLFAPPRSNAGMPNKLIMTPDCMQTRSIDLPFSSISTVYSDRRGWWAVSCMAGFPAAAACY